MKNEGGLDEGPQRFVLLRHKLPQDAAADSHWDLMFEVGKSLLTLQLPALPEDLDGGRPREIAARRLPDHRLQYLDYEGEIAGNRGSVRQVASGQYRRTGLSSAAGKKEYRLTSSMLNACVAFVLPEPSRSLKLSVLEWQLRRAD